MKIKLVKVLLGIALVLFLSVLVKAEIYTTPDGHLFEVNLIPDKTEIMLGEPVFLSFEIKNLSNVDLSFLDGGDYRNRLGRPESFSIKSIREDGKEVPVPEILVHFGGLVGHRGVSANGGTNLVRLFLPLWSPFEESGVYKVTCQKFLRIKNAKSSTKSDDILFGEGTPVSVTTKIKVVPKNEAETKKVISYWGNELIGKSYERSREALKALDYIGGERIIEPLIKAVENADKSFALDSVLRKLAEFDNEKAFRAIISQLSHESNSVRCGVADALAISKNPKTFGYLLKMKNDEDKFVRLHVLDALGKFGTPHAIQAIREMIKDPKNKDLIYYAQSYLNNTEVKSNK